MATQQNNAKSISTAAINRPSVTTTPIGVQTNISVTEVEKEYFKRFTSLNPTAEALPQGDGTIRISPFDDYVIFTIFDETGENGDYADTPIDLSNVGTLTLVFVGEDDEIRIPNWTQVQDVDLSQGQVLFRIDKENSKKILALDNQNFYISTRMEDEHGVSDESVLYTGTFLGLTDAAQESLTSKLNTQGLLYARELAELQATISRLNAKISELVSVVNEDTATISALDISNQELTNEVAVLSGKLGTKESRGVLANARAAQARARKKVRRNSQVSALRVAAQNQATQANQTRFYRQAASNLEEYNTSENTVSTVSGYAKGGSGGFDLEV